jgi:F-type H+-transporting ATPase subunit a
VHNVLEEFELEPIIHLKLFGINASIDKAVIVMWIASLLVAIMILYAARHRSLVPKGVANAVEAMIDFLRTDIVLENVGRIGLYWLPFLATLFFFILFNNLIGLVPASFSPTSNINVTATLAVIVFIAVQIQGMLRQGLVKYWLNLVPAGVPIFLKPVLLLIELISLVAKPFSLAVRLFANLFAGHVILLVFLSLIITYKSLIIAPFPLLGAVVVTLLEIMFSLIQAYIFTILSAIYIGAAMHAEH